MVSISEVAQRGEKHGRIPLSFGSPRNAGIQTYILLTSHYIATLTAKAMDYPMKGASLVVQRFIAPLAYAFFACEQAAEVLHGLGCL